MGSSSEVLLYVLFLCVCKDEITRRKKERDHHDLISLNEIHVRGLLSASKQIRDWCVDFESQIELRPLMMCG